MRFHAKYVSASEAGDYYQVSFDTEDPGKDSTDPRGLDTPYLMCRIERRPPRLDLTVYPYLPRATVAMTSAKTYLDLLTGASS